MKTIVFKLMAISTIGLLVSVGACKKDKKPQTPQLITTEITGSTIAEAAGGGTITNNGGAAITQTGLVWSSTNENPTISSNEGKTQEGPHNDQFTSFLPNLTESKTYYVRAYAINSAGTGYGSVRCILADVDANLYRTVKIGSQLWMLENLKTSHFKNGVQITYEQINWTTVSTPAFCFYANDVNNANTYGLLYNWYTVNDANNGLAPEGWRIPSVQDWQDLIIALGVDATTAGDKLKEAGNAHWEQFQGINPTNASGFTALPGGYRRHDTGTYSNLGQFGHFWTYGEDQANGQIFFTRLDYNTNNFNSYTVNYQVNAKPTKNYGLSVRCIKN